MIDYRFSISNLKCNNNSQSAMKIHSSIDQYKTMLENILSKDCASSSKAALLRSLKESLRRQLKIKQKQVLSQSNEENEFRQQYNTSKVKREELKATKKKQDSMLASRQGQQKQRKIFIGSLCKLFDERSKMNCKIYQIQGMWIKYTKSEQKKGQLKQYKSLKQRLAIKRQLTEAFMQLQNISQKIRVRYENFIDLVKILKVKYIRAKEDTQSAKVNLMKRTVSTKRVGQLIFDMRYNDENRNQILVNL